jgi:hypothetical protein
LNGFDMKNSPRATLRFVLQAVLAAALVAWLVRSGRLQWGAFATLDGRALGWAALALALQAAMIATQAARWRVWLAATLPHSSPASWREVLVVTLRGSCAGAWTPAALGMDGIRIAHVAREANVSSATQTETPTGSAQTAVAAVARAAGLASLLDRAVSLAVLVLLAAPGLAALSFAAGEKYAAVLGALAVLTAVALGVWWKAGRLKRLQKLDWWPRSVGWRAVGVGAAWSLGTQAANVGAFGAAVAALSPGLSLARIVELACATGPAVILSSALPLTPLGLGVVDATGEALLARHGVDCGGEAVMLARALWLMLSLAAGAAFWIPTSAAPAPEAS